MAVGGITKYTPPLKAGEIPLVCTRFRVSVENEQAGAEQKGRTCFARPNSQARTGQGNIHFPCSVDHEQDWQPYPVGPYSAVSD